MHAMRSVPPCLANTHASTHSLTRRRPCAAAWSVPSLPAALPHPTRPYPPAPAQDRVSPSTLRRRPPPGPQHPPPPPPRSPRPPPGLAWEWCPPRPRCRRFLRLRMVRHPQDQTCWSRRWHQPLSWQPPQPPRPQRRLTPARAAECWPAPGARPPVAPQHVCRGVAMDGRMCLPFILL